MNVPGYDYGRVARSPVTLDDLHRLEQTLGFDDADRRALLDAGEILRPQAEAMVDEWRAIIGAHEHLARWFFGPDGKPDDAYKAGVKRRFVQWVVDLCSRPFDQALMQAGVSGDRLERMQAAWAKAVMLTLTLWTEPYTKDGLW
jgi:hypothetical protein